MTHSTKDTLLSYFQSAVDAAMPAKCLPDYLKNIDVSNGICVLGAGKASADMAAVVYQYFGDKCYGAVVTRYGHSDVGDTGAIKIYEASHPVPDANGQIAAKAIYQLAKDNPADVPIVFLISGGGSALLCLPIDEITLEKKCEINKFLLKSGASIDEINTVRKQLSLIKGGQLARSTRSKMSSLIISDVVGDDPSLIASGPTVSDFSTPKKAFDILTKYQFSDDEILSILATSTRQPVELKNSDIFMVANAENSIDAAVENAQQAGWQTQVLSYEQEGEASEVAKAHAKLALEAKEKGQNVLLFSGGELTVTLKNSTGKGGPNQEYAMALAKALNGEKGISVLSCDTDGIDGSEEVAGAYIDETTLQRANELGVFIDDYLANHDSYHFFKELDDLIITGPTHTNVNDFRVIMVCS